MFIRSSTEEHLQCFNLLSIVNSAAVSSQVYANYFFSSSNPLKYDDWRHFTWLHSHIFFCLTSSDSFSCQVPAWHITECEVGHWVHDLWVHHCMSLCVCLVVLPNKLVVTLQTAKKCGEMISTPWPVIWILAWRISMIGNDLFKA